MQPVNPVLPQVGFVEEALLAPAQAIVAFFSRVTIAPPPAERIALDDALGRVLAQDILVDDDVPATRRSVMDGFAVVASATPGTFTLAAGVRMGAGTHPAITADAAARIPTGGVLPEGADAVVPIEDALVDGDRVTVAERVAPGAHTVERGADLRLGETALRAGRRLRAAEIGVLATLGHPEVLVHRRPVFGVLSTGDELIALDQRPEPGDVRDSNRYAIAASLRAMGAQPKHYPTLRDEPGEFESGLTRALAECDAVAVTGGSSVGERDRLPPAVAKIARPGVLVHGLRIKPGKPALLGADGRKPILGLPGNPASALLVLEAVARPIVAALCGAPVAASTVAARLSAPASSRPGWTWFVPVRLEQQGGCAEAHPLTIRSFSVGMLARADGFIVLDEGTTDLAAGSAVIVHQFLGG